MVGAAVVIVLAGLILPISMLLAAIAFDAILAAWVVYGFWHDQWRPKIVHSYHSVVGAGLHRPHPQLK